MFTSGNGILTNGLVRNGAAVALTKQLAKRLSGPNLASWADTLESLRQQTGFKLFPLLKVRSPADAHTTSAWTQRLLSRARGLNLL
jgi:hypothetical protein